MKKIIILITNIYLIGVNVTAQEQSISEEVRERYFSKQIEIGEVEKSLYDSLKIANTQHPSKFYEFCGSFMKDSMLNEAAMAYFIGQNRFRLYNKTNPDYEASGDGALAGSFAYAFGEPLSQYLNQNLDNYSDLLRKSGEWYNNNKYYYFKNSGNDSLYQMQTNSLLNNAKELKSNPLEYINKLELQRKELEEAINELNLESFETIIEDDNEQIHIPTSEVPQAFFSNYNGDHFKLNIENEITAVAHGWYDTYLESSDAKIIQNEVNTLHYKVIPNQIGVCVIELYGVREDGFKMQLAVYNINVIKK